MDIATPVRSAIFSPGAFWSLFGIALFVWIGMTAVLLYHWNTYAAGDARARRMKYIYYVGSAILFASAISFILSL